jgi:hypothetical protein
MGCGAGADVDNVWEQKKNSKPRFAKCLTRSVPHAVLMGDSPQQPTLSLLKDPAHIILVLVQDALLGGVSTQEKKQLD